MPSPSEEPGTTHTDPPSVLFLAPNRSEAETLETALARHDLSVSVAYDIAQTLDSLSTTPAECIVFSDTLSTMSSEAALDAIRDRDPLIPVVFLLTQTDDEFTDRLEDADTTDYILGDVESISYDRLADRIRAIVATYRTAEARRTEREITERLEERLYQTERKITALHSVAMEFNTISTVDEVYTRTVAAAEDILDLDICFAFAVEDDTFVPKAQSSTPTDRELGPVPLDSGAMGESYRTGESFRAVDMDLHTLADPEFGDYHSGISVPIGEFGVFQAVAEEVGAYNEIDLELTELLTAHAASVLQRISFEQKLRIERDRYASLFSNSSDCILEAEFVGEDSIIRRVNPAFEAVFGYDESELLGRDIDAVVVSDDRYEKARTITDRVREGEIVETEVRRQTSDGLKDFLLRSVPVDEGTMYAVYTDISDQKERERTISQQKDRLDEFASTVSHDLRNPLNVAEGRIELAKEQYDSEHIDRAARAVDRGLDLIDDMLELARAGEQVSDKEPVELAELVHTSWGNVQTSTMSLIADIDTTIRADRSRLRQLLENLFRNAADHAGDDVTVTVGEVADGFYVADDGPGIPETDRRDVLEAGYSMTENGTGFGLSIVEEIVEAHGWEIRVSESADGGARFEITGVEFAGR